MSDDRWTRTSQRVEREAERDAERMDADRAKWDRILAARERTRPGTTQAMQTCEQFERDFQMSSSMAYNLLSKDPHAPRAWDGMGSHVSAAQTVARRVAVVERLRAHAKPWMVAYCFLNGKPMPEIPTLEVAT